MLKGAETINDLVEVFEVAESLESTDSGTLTALLKSPDAAVGFKGVVAATAKKKAADDYQTKLTAINTAETAEAVDDIVNTFINDHKAEIGRVLI